MRYRPLPTSAATLALFLSCLAVGASRGADLRDSKDALPKSAKERLSDKASDEQRVNNCRVPVERRGAKPRPDCPEVGKPTAGPARIE